MKKRKKKKYFHTWQSVRKEGKKNSIGATRATTARSQRRRRRKVYVESPLWKSFPPSHPY